MKNGPQYPVQNLEGLRSCSSAFTYDNIYNWFQGLPSDARTRERSAVVRAPDDSAIYKVDLQDGGRIHLKSIFTHVSGVPRPTVMVISRRMSPPREWDEQAKMEQAPVPERPPIDYLGDPAIAISWKQSAQWILSLKASGVRDQHDPTLLFVTSRNILRPQEAELQALAIGRLILGPPEESIVALNP